MARTLTAMATLFALGTAVQADERPNILLIVADDLLYTDLSVTGGEIATPHIGSIAQSGTLFTDFIVAPNCSPTRAMLMSGTDSHLAGLGLMAEMPKAANQKDQPGYFGYLNDGVHAFPLSLQDAGYNTYMAGKWHLGGEEGQRPDSKGFGRSFALMQGGASHYDDMARMSPREVTAYFEDGQPVSALPKDFFSSDFYTDLMIDYIGDDEEEPFFAYLAYTAPHWPLQAPAEWIEPFEGKYDAGYEVLKDQRIEGLVKAGLFPEDAPANDFVAYGENKHWNTLTPEEREMSSWSMEIHAGMVSNLDWNIGRIVDHLKGTGQYDNTVIVFMSDNGAEGANMHWIWNRYPDALKEPFYADIDNSPDNMGKAGSFVFYNAWGQAGVGPYHAFKGMTGRGGVKTFMMMKPAGGSDAAVNDSLVTVMDLAPTLLDLAGAEHPIEVRSQTILPHKGISLLPVVDGEVAAVRGEDDIIGSELLHNSGLRKGDWRIVWNRRGPFSTENWMLFDLVNDPAETNDVSAQNPEKLAEMMAAWDGYVSDNNLIFPAKADK